MKLQITNFQDFINLTTGLCISNDQFGLKFFSRQASLNPLPYYNTVIDIHSPARTSLRQVAVFKSKQESDMYHHGNIKPIL